MDSRLLETHYFHEFQLTNRGIQDEECEKTFVMTFCWRKAGILVILVPNFFLYLLTSKSFGNSILLKSFCSEKPEEHILSGMFAYTRKASAAGRIVLSAPFLLIICSCRDVMGTGAPITLVQTLIPSFSDETFGYNPSPTDGKPFS